MTLQSLPPSLELPVIGKEKSKLNLIPGQGRPAGVVNKITRDLKEGIISAAEIVGSDGNGEGGLTGFLVDLALHHKRAFASLLVKLLPMQVNGHVGSHSTTVNIVGVEHDHYLSVQDIQRLTAPALIDQAPPPEPEAVEPSTPPRSWSGLEPEPEPEPEPRYPPRPHPPRKPSWE